MTLTLALALAMALAMAMAMALAMAMAMALAMANNYQGKKRLCLKNWHSMKNIGAFLDIFMWLFFAVLVFVVPLFGVFWANS